VTRTVKDLLTGTHHQFHDHGLHTFKGVEEPWRLYSLPAQPEPSGLD
jgi:class 3 adenylate cyclase